MKETLKKIRLAQLKLNRLATDVMAGAYHSAFKGRGLEFEEVREFQPGDEIRSVDWNVTARYGTPYVKTFREERNLTALLALDISGSTRFGSGEKSKRELLAQVASCIAFSGIKNNDRLGIILFSDQIELYTPPARGAKHGLRIIRDLLAFEAQSSKTSLQEALRFVLKVQKKRALLFLLSDFQGPMDWMEEIGVASHKYDLIAVCANDPLERGFPDSGLVPLKDLETGKTLLVDSGADSLNPSLEKQFNEHLAACKKAVLKKGGSWLEVNTRSDYVQTLRKFFSKKLKKCF